ncbi:aspartyl protease family protein [Aureibaculum sp. 2210JD6-5]|uniref:retropepsin-like aspartic protease n=1 Tax=Aureibaculum sp. 2210JD6-5 TaxID=3103957 RepID=UPI002AAE014C|nr:aspartyl protease family protein [Aureibaculum sp. 2210JD6-5]MDY7393708.1 aspartyl protease family protein [Aureibaculum sp. 2210JD6-5]
MKVRFLHIILLLYLYVSGNAQDRFNILGNKDSYAVSFKMVNNLIIIPIEVNGVELNFLLDTGVDNSLLINLKLEDSLNLKNVEEIRLRGLGEGDHVNAIRSKNNTFKLGKIFNNKHMVCAIHSQDLDLSSRLGIDINGIIGGDLFRDFIVEINYATRRVKFSNPDTYKYKDCKRCEDFDLHFYKNKPYIYATVDVEKEIPVKLLIDSGGSDALWLFDESSLDISIPERHFNDYLGRGLSGNVYGKRSKIKKIMLGSYILEDANVAYPDFNSIERAYKHEGRNGSIGSEILKRFRIVYDYPNKRLTIKKPSKYFKDPFLYNMSGIEISHNGNVLVGERQKSMANDYGNESEQSTVQLVYSYVYALKPSYIIAELRKDSPAYKAGLLKGDIVLKINGKAAYNYKLQDITYLFSSKEGKKIKLLIERNGIEMQYEFKLEKLL